MSILQEQPPKHSNVPWYRDFAFWTVIISFGVFLTILALIVFPVQKSFKIQSRRQPAGIHSVEPLTLHRVTIDARNYQHWVYYSFSKGIVHHRYVTSLEWDLAFRRYHVLANGGSFNLAGNGGILDLGNANADTQVKAPIAGYVLDTKAPNGRESENLAIGHWYNYDYASHVLTPRKHWYVVRTPQSRYYLFRILDYYCKAMQSGCMTIEFRKLL